MCVPHVEWKTRYILFTHSTNILVRLPTVNMKNSYPNNRQKMCDPILVVTLLRVRPHDQTLEVKNFFLIRKRNASVNI